MPNNLTEQSLEVLNNIEINKSVIKPTFEPSDERNKNSDITSTRKLFKLSELNFKRETQAKLSGQCECLDCCEHV